MTALTMVTRLRTVAYGGAESVTLGLALTAAWSGSASGTSQAHLAEVRAATARYHAVEDAVSAGYVDLGLCFDQMGEHYGRPDAIDGTLDPTAPEALVYARVRDRLKLVAVEYASTRPGEVLGQRLHYNPAVELWVLHAWVWKHNPDGMHADFNPRVGACT